ncbi:MAG TPA: glycosyltransferase [Oscillospiraceae bacterium]|nr:glycosyltransferase [Oscillospiraceae bacterium]HPS35117.1 glycosyltransferase [Oscillospiraceae bacterium]
MNILILSSGYFPYGGAYASRLLNFCRAIEQNNSIHVITWFDSQVDVDNLIFEICTYEHLCDSHNKIENYILPSKLVKKALDYINQNKVDLVISSRMPISFGSLLNLCKKKRIPLVIEQCEWIDPSNFKFNRFHPMYFLGENNMKRRYKKANGIIAISRLLENHFSSQGISTIRIPTILDVLDTEYSTKTINQPTVISYCGSPGTSKENLKNIIETLTVVNCESVRIKLNIYGPDRNAVMKNTGYDNEHLLQIKDYVNIYGSIPQPRIAGVIKASDYTFFARPDRQSSNAGFPTKFAESMACGTPVITNLTGDIELYLKDGINGHVLDSITPESINKVLCRIINESPEDRQKLRKCARETAEISFDYRIYSSIIEKFLQSIIQETEQ